ncbi:MAG: putative glycosyltransferase EpsE [Chlamydiae bacterium]|nr:putative glycosyltransferase EpsE [Chlamydiota bacterium]
MQKNFLRYLLIPLLFLILGTTDVRADSAAKNKSFVVVIPSYNNKDHYEKNLNSVFSQTYQNFRVIYIDDASPDGTGALVEAYLRDNNLEDRVTVIINETNVGALANKYNGISLCKPDEIVVDLDGDDWLAHPKVLADLNKIYADPDVWVTYGQFIYHPAYQVGFCADVPKPIIEHNAFRVLRGYVSALRTFYAGLFHQIKKEDLLYEGEFFTAASDIAFIIPILEMAGAHSRFTPEVSYVYNINTPINDFKVRHNHQVKMDELIRAKPKYQPLSRWGTEPIPKRIYITPGWWGQLFAIHNPRYNRDNCLDVLYKLRQTAAESGYELLQANSLASLQDFNNLIVFDIFLEQLPYLASIPKEKQILFLWEPPSVSPHNYNRDYHRYFSKIYTWNDELVDNEKYFKFYCPIFHPMISNPVDFHEKKFSTLVAGYKSSNYPLELYSERINLINFFENLPGDDFELYGKNWPLTYKNYRGPIDKKVDILKNYKFCFAYENTKGIPGYVTEKIFDCFHAGTVPIYLGAPNITDYVPEDCFIAREDFADNSSLYNYLKSMSEEEYNGYLSNIKRFLKSEKARLFSEDHFIEIVMDLIRSEPSKLTID